MKTSEHWKSIENRRGTFRISRVFLASIGEKEMNKIFEGMIIVSAQSRFMPDDVEYQAYSRHFHEVGMGRVAPVYQCEFKQHRGEDGNIYRVTRKWATDEVI